MPVASTTPNALAAWLCAAFAAGCASSASSPSFDPSGGNPGDGGEPAATAESGTSSEDGSAVVDSMAASHSDADASAPASGSPNKLPDAGGAGSASDDHGAPLR